LQFEKDRPPFLKTTLNVSLDFTNNFNSFLGFLGLGLGFFLPQVSRIRVRVKQDGPCICIYVSSIIRNSILYIGFTYMYASRIIFCMVLSTWSHTKILYVGRDNVFALPNLQTPSFKFSQVVFAPLRKFVWCLLNVNFCHNNFAKLHCSHMTLDWFETLVDHEKVCLLPSFKVSTLFTSKNERSWYFLEVTWN
jgi:hypothetical protein